MRAIQRTEPNAFVGGWSVGHPQLSEAERVFCSMSNLYGAITFWLTFTCTTKSCGPGAVHIQIRADMVVIYEGVSIVVCAPSAIHTPQSVSRLPWGESSPRKRHRTKHVIKTSGQRFSALGTVLV